jgi:hypothetical protein
MSLKDKYQVNNVFVSAVTPENISRQQLLAWVNDSLQVCLPFILIQGFKSNYFGQTWQRLKKWALAPRIACWLTVCFPDRYQCTKSNGIQNLTWTILQIGSWFRIHGTTSELPSQFKFKHWWKESSRTISSSCNGFGVSMTSTMQVILLNYYIKKLIDWIVFRLRVWSASCSQQSAVSKFDRHSFG